MHSIAVIISMTFAFLFLCLNFNLNEIQNTYVLFFPYRNLYSMDMKISIIHSCELCVCVKNGIVKCMFVFLDVCICVCVVCPNIITQK